MRGLRLRNLLVILHLVAATFVAPVFILLALSGGLYLTGNKGNTEKTVIELPANSQLNIKSETLQSDIENLLEQAGINLNFEYVKVNGNDLYTRPTSRTFVHFSQTPSALKAYLVKPSLQFTLIELHKGHGPQLFRVYQIIAAISLFFTIINGLIIGLMAPAYRKIAVTSLVAGTALFVLLAFIV